MKNQTKTTFSSVIAAALMPLAVAANPVWPDFVVQLHSAGKAFIVDTQSDAVTATINTCKGGGLGSITPDATKVYVSCAAEGESEVVVIDTGKGEVTQRLKTGSRPKHGLVSPDGKWVGVDHWGLSDGKLRVTFIDTASDSIVKTIDIAVQGEPKGVTSMHNVWSLDSRYFFTLDRVDNRLVVIDTTNFKVRTVATPSTPHYPVISPNGKELWLIHEGNATTPTGIVVYDISKAKLPEKARMDLPLMGEEVAEGHHGNFTQDGKIFMALNRGPASDMRGREVAFFNARKKELVQRLTTASNGIGHTYNTPNGKQAVVTNYGNNLISIIDIKSQRVIKDLRIGKGRMGHIAFTQDGNFGYLSNAGDGNLWKIDMQQLAVVKEIATGGGMPGGAQVMNVWTNVFEELPRVK
jgi:DNA-binding beta-propeller fold protein YncE